MVILRDNQGGGELFMTSLDNFFAPYWVSLDKYLDLYTASLLVFPKQKFTQHYPGRVSSVSTQMVQYMSNNKSSKFLDFTVRKL